MTEPTSAASRHVSDLALRGVQRAARDTKATRLPATSATARTAMDSLTSTSSTGHAMAVPRPAANLAHPLALPDEAARTAISTLLRRNTGIEIEGERGAFLRARLAGRLTALGLRDFGSYTALLHRDAEERRRCIEALTTHTTSFFREGRQYDWLAETGLAALFEQGAATARPLTIWSAACSSGQEGYSALMTLAETARAHGITGPRTGQRTGQRTGPRAALVGSDISTAVLAQARLGVFGPGEAAGFPEAMQARYLMRARAGDGRVRIVPELRALSRWVSGNLAEPASLPELTADIVFLRNVLIYFAPETRARVLDGVLSRLRPQGYLLVGHAEAGAVRHPSLVTLRPSIFMKAG